MDKLKKIIFTFCYFKKINQKKEKKIVLMTFIEHLNLFFIYENEYMSNQKFQMCANFVVIFLRMSIYTSLNTSCKIVKLYKH